MEVSWDLCFCSLTPSFGWSSSASVWCPAFQLKTSCKRILQLKTNKQTNIENIVKVLQHYHSIVLLFHLILLLIIGWHPRFTFSPRVSLIFISFEAFLEILPYCSPYLSGPFPRPVDVGVVNLGPVDINIPLLGAPIYPREIEQTMRHIVEWLNSCVTLGKHLIFFEPVDWA